MESVKILFATDNFFLPQDGGGLGRNTHELCISLLRRSLSVAVLASLEPHNLIWLGNRVRSKLRRSERFPVDQIMGYPAFRGWSPTSGVGEVVRRYRPDIAIIQASRPMKFAEHFIAEHVPCIIYLHGAVFEKPRVAMNQEGLDLDFATNSEFTARKLKRQYGVEPTVIPPLVDPDRYRVESTRRKVVFVNPTKIKGLDIALHLAECRKDIEFEFVESWKIPWREWRTLRARVNSLGNVVLRRKVSDMRSLYRHARLLLVPSVWEEPWGRVVTEAHISGIPVLASTRGGLPESVGPGGILVDPDSEPAVWEEALSRLWDNTEAYERLSGAALEYSRRAEIQPDYLLQKLMTLIAERLKNASANSA